VEVRFVSDFPIAMMIVAKVRFEIAVT